MSAPLSPANVAKVSRPIPRITRGYEELMPAYRYHFLTQSNPKHVKDLRALPAIPCDTDATRKWSNVR